MANSPKPEIGVGGKNMDRHDRKKKIRNWTSPLDNKYRYNKNERKQLEQKIKSIQRRKKAELR